MKYVRIIAALLCLLLLVSCATEPTSDDSSINESVIFESGEAESDNSLSEESAVFDKTPREIEFIEHVFPASLKTIGNYAFTGAKYNLTTCVFPSGLESIGTSAFGNCSILTSVTFQGTPTSIANNAFPSNVTTINVPWAEGAVANAPWGATKATINYNYVG